MPEETTLLRPLRSDSLKPRPSPQAVWEPGPAAEPADLQPVFEPIHLHTLSDLPHLPEAPKEAEPAADVSELDILISSMTAAEDDDEDLEPDALPTEQMPEPVCVPLYEAFSPVRRRHVWPWLALIAVLAAGGAYALWHFGCLPPNWA